MTNEEQLLLPGAQAKTLELIWKWLEKPPCFYSVFGILRLPSVVPCNPSSPLFAGAVLGILGTVCSSFLPSRLSRSLLLVRLLLLVGHWLRLAVLLLICSPPCVDIRSPTVLFFILNIFSLHCPSSCQWLSIDLWLLSYDADYTCTSHIVELPRRSITRPQHQFSAPSAPSNIKSNYSYRPTYKWT